MDEGYLLLRGLGGGPYQYQKSSRLKTIFIKIAYFLNLKLAKMDQEIWKIISERACQYIVRWPRKLPPQENMVSKIAYFLELKLDNLWEWLENNSEVCYTYKIGEQESTVTGIVYLLGLWTVFYLLFHIVLNVLYFVLDMLICIYLLTRMLIQDI